MNDDVTRRIAKQLAAKADKPRTWDRDTILPFAREVAPEAALASPAAWNTSGDVMRRLDQRDGRSWQFAWPQAAVDAGTAVKRVGTAPLLGPIPRTDAAREQMIESAGAVVGPMAGVGMARAAVMPRVGSSEVGIFGGRLAKTADQAALAKAEGMAASSVPRDQIWNETGWFQGPDKKWRFEIDDSGTKALDPFNEPGLADIHMRADPNTKGNTKPVALHLDDIMPHEGFYDAYGYDNSPLVGFDKMAAKGSYDGNQDYVRLDNSYVLEPDFGRSILLHELQHAAQKREGFARGGSTREFSSGEGQPDPVSLYRRLAGETEARAVQTRRDLTADQRRERPPWLDYDVPEDQQIVRFK